MIYKFCDFYVDMSPNYDYTLSMAEKFRYYGEIPNNATVITVGEKTNIKYCEYVHSQEDYSHLPIGEVEHIILEREFHTKVLDYDSIMLHSSAVKYKNKCYLFSAPSQVGKSTHTRLWKKLYDVTILNDDKPVIRLSNGKALVYGSPFAGGTYVCEDDFAKLGGIVFVERAFDNSIKEISYREAIPRFLQGTISYLNQDKMNKVLDILNELFKMTKFYLLSCNTDDEAAVVAHDFIVKDDNYEG